MKKTGQRSIDGIRLYKIVSSDQEEMVSSVLNGCTSNNSPKKPKLDVCTSTSSLPCSFNLSNCFHIKIEIHK